MPDAYFNHPAEGWIIEGSPFLHLDPEHVLVVMIQNKPNYLIIRI